MPAPALVKHGALGRGAAAVILVRGSIGSCTLSYRGSVIDML